MNILLINHYAGSPRDGMEYRPYYLAREWVRAGHRVQIVAAAYSHVRSRQPAMPDSGGGRDETIDGIAYRWLPAPAYAGNGVGRVKNIWAFLSRLWRESKALVQAFQPDVVIASRILGQGALKGGMPFYKYVSNRFITFVENLLVGRKHTEYHTGYRAYSRKVLETLPFRKNSDNFIFDNQFLVQVIGFGFSIGEISCPTKYFKEASSIGLRASIRYGFGCLYVSFRYFLHRLGVKSYPIMIR